MREITIDKLITWGMLTTFISTIVFLIYAVYITESVYIKCLNNGYVDAHAGITYSKSHCIDKYKGIVVPFNKI